MQMCRFDNVVNNLFSEVESNKVQLLKYSFEYFYFSCPLTPLQLWLVASLQIKILHANNNDLTKDAFVQNKRHNST